MNKCKLCSNINKYTCQICRQKEYINDINNKIEKTKINWIEYPLNEYNKWAIDIKKD